MRLRFQDQPILQHLQVIGPKRDSGRGDVDDQLGASRGVASVAPALSTMR